MKKKTVEEKKVVRVYCANCLHSTRDTSGHSYSIETGEYFMGTCARGGSDCGELKRRVFMNKPRECDRYRRR